jgi:hypothetical protein
MPSMMTLSHRWTSALLILLVTAGCASDEKLTSPEPAPEPGPGVQQAKPGGDRKKDVDSSEERAEAVKHSRETAQKSLATYKAIWQSDPSHKNDEWPKVEWTLLDDPFPVTVIDSDNLDEGRQGELNAENVFSLSPREMIYPVLAGHKLVGAVTLRKEADDWAVVSYGGENLTEGLVQLRRIEAEKEENRGTQYWAVSVISLDHFFLACKRERHVRLIPLASSPSFGWKSGESIPATILLPKLVRASSEDRWVTD